VVLVVVTKSDIENYNGLGLLEISVGVATYRVSPSANADKLVTQTTDYTAAGGSARVFAYDQTMRDFVGTWRLERRESGNDMATLVELGLPETIGAGTGCSGRTEKTLQQMVSEQQVVDGVSLNELIDETSVDSTDTDAALLLVLAGGETESWLLLVRAGCSPDNTEVRGVGVCTCSPVDDKSYSIDFVTRVVDSCDLESAAESAERLVVVVSTPDSVTLHSLDASGGLSSATEAAKLTCLALAPRSAILMARQLHGGVPLDLIRAYLQGNPAAAVQPGEAALIPGDWRRERVVVDVPSDARNTRLHLLFERTKNNDLAPSVGLDDMQLLPVLSNASLWKDGDLEAFVYVPSKAELIEVSLGHLRRYSDVENDDPTDDNYWERVHVTVALMGASEELDGCGYDAQFLYVRGEVGEDPVEEKLPIGCVLEASSAHVRGVWAQCMLELPAIEVGDVRLLVRVSPQSIEEKCVLQPADSVLVFFNANTALYECPADAFLAGGSAM
jgi:hypothetical protein